jgi:hypothetical protein
LQQQHHEDQQRLHTEDQEQHDAQFQFQDESLWQSLLTEPYTSPAASRSTTQSDIAISPDRPIPFSPRATTPADNQSTPTKQINLRTTPAEFRRTNKMARTPHRPPPPLTRRTPPEDSTTRDETSAQTTPLRRYPSLADLSPTQIRRPPGRPPGRPTGAPMYRTPPPQEPDAQQQKETGTRPKRQTKQPDRFSPR